jgi:RNA recognition motif-containing protein
MGRKLYVGNLPYETGEVELQELFGRAGTVETVNVVRDRATGRARGFAFVEMSTDAEAQHAIAEFNDYQLGGRGLAVNEARPDSRGGTAVPPLLFRSRFSEPRPPGPEPSSKLRCEGSLCCSCLYIRSSAVQKAGMHGKASGQY